MTRDERVTALRLERTGALGRRTRTSRLIFNVEGGPFVESAVDRAHDAGLGWSGLVVGRGRD